jgi:hypothetical protein
MRKEARRQNDQTDVWLYFRKPGDEAPAQNFEFAAFQICNLPERLLSLRCGLLVTETMKRALTELQKNKERDL